MLLTAEMDPRASVVALHTRTLHSPVVKSPLFNMPARQQARRNARILFRLTLVLADAAMLIFCFGIAAYARLGEEASHHFLPLIAVTLPIYFGVALNSRAYDTQSIHEAKRSIRRALASLLFTIGAVALVVFFLQANAAFSRLAFGSGALLAFPAIAFARYFTVRRARRVLGATPYVQLLIRDGETLDLGDDIPSLDAAAHGLAPNPADPLCVQRLGNYVRSVDRVIVACSPEKRKAWAFLLKALDIHADIYAPELAEIGVVGTNRVGRIPTLTVSTGPLSLRHRVAKRTFDLMVILPLLPVLAIPMLIVALMIKLETPGPVLFKQARIGLGNRPFKILKFRSMRDDSCDLHGSRSTSRDDDRITRFGRFIRATSIDELPQILNVLIGNMSIVGPRPHAVGSRAENMLFWDIDQRYWHRHAVKPGLTGLAQIRGYRGATEVRADLSNRLQADLEYRANWSLLGDIGIILSTFKVLVHRNAF